ncbi:MAG: hypothetical protein RML38_06560 [Bacteroidia bacterium]|nr:hypothetical protein [Bacteroidia bacterium]
MKKNKKKKILFGAVDVNWRISSYTKYLQSIYGDKIEIHSFVKSRVPKDHYHTQYTYSFDYQKLSKFNQWLISFYFFIVALFRYDILYFISGETLLTRKLMAWELRWHKKLGKKIIMHFVGSDLRSEIYVQHKNAHIQEYLEGTLENMPPKQTEWQKKLCRLAMQYADLILVSTPDLIEFFDTKEKVKYFPVMLDVEDVENQIKHIMPEKYPQRDKIRIVHSPSNISLKGTDYINAVMKKICAKNSEIEYINGADPSYKNTTHRLCGLTRYSLFELLQKSDILIDQIVIGWYGLQSIEAIYCQNEVIAWIEPELRAYLPSDAPFYICEQSLEKSIMEAIENVKNGRRKSRREYVIRYHTLENSPFLEYIKAVLD